MLDLSRDTKSQYAFEDSDRKRIDKECQMINYNE